MNIECHEGDYIRLTHPILVNSLLVKYTVNIIIVKEDTQKFVQH